MSGAQPGVRLVPCNSAPARMASAKWLPTNPVTPVMRIRMADRSSRLSFESLEIGIDHHVDEAAEIDFGFPAERRFRLGRVADQEIDFRRANEGGINDDILLPIEPDVTEGYLDEFTHGMRRTRRDDIIVRLFLLQHHPHGTNIVAGKAPVALGVEIAEPQFLGEPELDLGDALADLASDEFSAAARAFVIEEDAAAAVHAVTFAVIHRNEVAVNFRHAVGASRIEWGHFRLGHFLHLAEHFA